MPPENESKEFLKVEIESSEVPLPVHYDEEVAATNALLDLCESEQFDPWMGSLHPRDMSVTPWVALQLGCVAEAVASTKDYSKAYRIAVLSVRIAIALKSVSRLYPNSLTLAGVLLRSGRIEEAESQFYQILELPYPGGDTEKASAHVSLGSIFKRKGKTHEAIYHYERGLTRLKDRISSEDYLATIKTYSFLYFEIQDTAGLLHCSSLVNRASALDSLSQLQFDKMRTDEMLLLTTRLYSLQEPELADSAFSLWLSATPKQGAER